MKLSFNNILLAICFIMLIPFVSCKKDKDNSTGPEIRLKTEQGYTSKDDTLMTGAKFRIGIIADAGSTNITNFIIKCNNEIFIDTGFNMSSLNFDRFIIKGINNIDLWTFIIRDKEGKSASLSFTIYKDSNSVYGEIKFYSSILLGAQNNVSVGSFLSLADSKVYKQDEAFSNQQLIEILYYYDNIQADKNTIASPGASIDASVYLGSTGLANWSAANKNTTYFVKTGVSTTEFDAVRNDSLLLSSYRESDGKRKAKILKAGDVYSFKTQSLKYGLFKVVSVTGAETGTVVVDIKVQK